MLLLRKTIPLLLLAILCLTSVASAREVYIKDWGWVEVDNEHFVSLQDRMKNSDRVNRMFYDKDNSYLLVSVSGVFEHYCGISQDTLDSWLDAASMGEYYLENIQGNFDCQTTPPPDYRR